MELVARTKSQQIWEVTATVGDTDSWTAVEDDVRPTSTFTPNAVLMLVIYAYGKASVSGAEALQRREYMRGKYESLQRKTYPNLVEAPQWLRDTADKAKLLVEELEQKRKFGS